MIYYCDNKRHLIYVPYTIDNLHKMAESLGINKHWFRVKGRNYHPHYDIPKKRIEEIKSKCIVVSQKQILTFIKERIR